MSFSLATLWHERGRFLPGILAVGFSALLIAVQCGLLLGLLSLTSIPVDHATADVWAGHPAVLSVDLGRPIPEGWLARVAAEPEVEHSEVYMQALLMVDNPAGQSNVCTIIGTRVDDDSLGAVRELTPAPGYLGALAVEGREWNLWCGRRPDARPSDRTRNPEPGTR